MESIYAVQADLRWRWSPFNGMKISNNTTDEYMPTVDNNEFDGDAVTNGRGEEEATCAGCLCSQDAGTPWKSKDDIIESMKTLSVRCSPTASLGRVYVIFRAPR